MVQVPDYDHLHFGWWLQEKDDGSRDFQTFAGGTGFTVGAGTVTAAMTGAATYRGAAAGVYASVDVAGGQVTGATEGEFTAEATLTAHFFGTQDDGEISWPNRFVQEHVRRADGGMACDAEPRRIDPTAGPPSRAKPGQRSAPERAATAAGKACSTAPAATRAPRGRVTLPAGSTPISWALVSRARSERARNRRQVGSVPGHGSGVFGGFGARGLRGASGTREPAFPGRREHRTSCVSAPLKGDFGDSSVTDNRKSPNRGDRKRLPSETVEFVPLPILTSCHRLKCKFLRHLTALPWAADAAARKTCQGESLMKLFRPILPITGCVMLFASFCLAAPAAGGMETTAKQAYIVDLQTRAVLLEKDSGTPSPPASLSKLMTIYMVFEQLKSRQTLARR